MVLQEAQVATHVLVNRTPAGMENLDGGANRAGPVRMHVVRSEGVVVHLGTVAGGAVKIDRRGDFFRRELRLLSLGRSGYRYVVEVYSWWRS